MSEKIYAFFLRLYPTHFCDEYGHEALQLFRDRARDERGFFARLRLWFEGLRKSRDRRAETVPAPDYGN